LNGNAAMDGSGERKKVKKHWLRPPLSFLRVEYDRLPLSLDNREYETCFWILNQFLFANKKRPEK